MKSYLLAISFYLLNFVLYAQDSIIVLRNTKDLQLIGKQVSYLEEPAGKTLTIKEILQPEYQQKFQHNKTEVYNSPSSPNALWFKLTVKNEMNQDAWLSVGSIFFCWYVDFYRPDSLGMYGKAIETGTMRPANQKEYPVNFYWLFLANSQNQQPQTYYVRVNTRIIREYPLQVGSLTALHQHKTEQDFLIAGFIGWMSIMFFYNLFLFSATKDKIYLLYVLTLFVITLSYPFTSGYGIPSISAWWLENHMVPAGLVNNMMALFVVTYLGLQKKTKRLYKFILVLMGLMTLMAIANLVGVDILVLWEFYQLLFVITLFTLLGSGIYLLFKGDRTARFFVAGWAFSIGGTIMSILTINGVLPFVIYYRQAAFVGTCLEVLMFSLALGDRLNTMRKEKETAQAATLKLMTEQNEVLEIKVRERTEELSEALQEVNTINEELSSTNEALGSANEEITAQREAVTQAYNNITTLTTIGQHITQTLDIKVIIKMVYEHVNNLLPADCFGLGIYDGRTKDLLFEGFMEKGQELPFYVQAIANENELAAWCFRNKQAIVINNVAKEIGQYLKQPETLLTQVGEVPQSMLYLPLLLENEAVGVITVQSFEKNTYTSTHVGLLENLATYCSIAVANANAYQEIDFKNANITKSIEYAKTIQQAILPKSQELCQIFTNTFVIYKPKDIVSGDFYWYSQNQHGAFLAVADCTGHGVPGGFMSMIGNAILQDAIDKQQLSTPSEVLTTLHTEIRKALKKPEESTSDGMDIALCRFVKTHDTTWEVLFSAAKRPLHVYEQRTKQLLEFKGDKTMIGGADASERKPFTNQRIEVVKGDKLYFSTDGFADQPNENRKRFGVIIFKNMLLETAHLSMQEQQVFCLNALTDFQGTAEQRDDITLVGVEM